MAYPRKCEGCDATYVTWNGFASFPHVTLAAHDGGTPSPWNDSRPGRLLDLRCELCGAVFRWDYFARADDRRLGRTVALLRDPIPGWRAAPAATSANRGWRGAERAEQRRAS